MTTVHDELSTAPPPTHLEAEAAVLGACLHSVSIAHAVVETLDPDDLDRHAHRVVFEAVAALLDAGHHVDPVTLTALLAANDQLDEVGGAAALHDLHRFVPCPPAWRSYAAIVQHAADRRRRIRELLAELRDLGVTIEEAS